MPHADPEARRAYNQLRYQRRRAQSATQHVPCMVDTCEESAKAPGAARGWCPRHYQRWRKHDDPVAPWAPEKTKRYPPDAVCVFEDCPQPRFEREWCAKHYQRNRVHGDPAIVLKTPNGTRQAWIDQLAQEAPMLPALAADLPCRDWPFGKGEQGQSKQRPTMNGRTVANIVLEKVKGPAPSPQHQALHSCDRGRCCAPWHLRWGTRKENMADMRNRQRGADQKRQGLMEWVQAQGLDVPEYLQ
jgi:hypothetical protein